MQNISYTDAVRYLIFTTSIVLEQVRTKYELLCVNSAYIITSEILIMRLTLVPQYANY